MRQDLVDLFGRDGPFATVYLTSASDVPQAAQALAVRWKRVRKTLEGQGATDAVLDALDQRVAAAGHAAGDTLALVAAGDDVVVHWHLAEPPRADAGWVATLPRVGPVLETDQTMLPHLVVLCDRTGADIYGFTSSGRAVQHEVGDDDGQEVQRFAAGGWSQKRYQQRQINDWAENAREVADEVARLAKAIDARLIAVGGDVHAVGFFKDSLPADLQPFVHDIDGASRHPDGGADHVADDARRLVDTVVASETTAIIQEFKEECGQDDRAALGLARVLEALQTGSVGTLLVHDDPDDMRTAWFGPDPLQVSIDEGAMRAMGVDEPHQARAVDVCIRAALGSSAEIRVVPKAVLKDNVGAILRFKV